MVDAIVSFVAEKIATYLFKEAAFLGGVNNEVEWILWELKSMQPFIKGAERQPRNPLIRRWISQVRDIAFKTEDVLDEYMLKFHEEETLNAVKFVADLGGASRPGSGIASGLKTAFKYYWNGEYKLIGKEIESLKTGFIELSRQRQAYGFESIGSNINSNDERIRVLKLKQQSRSISLNVERNFVGLVNGIEELLAMLVPDDNPSDLVIWIRGMGGLGKTTLAKKLYHNERVVKRFQYRFWVNVSRDYDIRDLLLRITKSFKIVDKEPLEDQSEEDLEELIRQFLKVHSCLLVIDDVWKTEDWSKILKAAFPDNHKGSRVIITTREQEVFIDYSHKRTHVHQLKALNSYQSKQLFCEEVYGDLSPRFHLSTMEMNMVERCQGLPLTIILLAGLLWAKGSSRQWLHPWRSLQEDDFISGFLALCFDDLSRHLKLCFLYLGLFPGDFKINAKHVIQLWVAEGLVDQEDNHLVLEDVAAMYLNELANRKLIQIEETYRNRITYFRLHDLLRDLAIQKGRELNFMDVHNNNPVSSSALCQHQATHHGVEMYLSLQNHNPKLRTFFSFEKLYRDKKEIKLTELLETLSEESKLLRVLNITRDAPGKLSSFFQIIKYCVIPEQIGTLIHLRYLGIKNVRICKVPSSIANLNNLQTLDFLCYPKHRVRLPVDICKLTELRHLLGEFIGPVPIDNLAKLQTLKYVSCQSWIESNPEKLVNLQELCIRQENDEKNIMEFHFESFTKLPSLITLSVVLTPSTTFSLSLPLCRFNNLIDLTLRGKIEKLPAKMHKSFPYLKYLSLQIYNTRDDPMPTLEKMEFLTELELKLLSYRGPQKMVCSPLGFVALEILTFMVSELVELQVEEGGMPRLRSFKGLADHRFAIPERLRAVFNPDC